MSGTQHSVPPPPPGAQSEPRLDLGDDEKK